MSEDTPLYKLAISFVKRMTPAIVRRLYESGLTARDFFTDDIASLNRLLLINREHCFTEADRQSALGKAGKEMENMLAHGVRGYFLMDTDYPSRLSVVEDPPIFLYQLGGVDLNSRHIINVVGTRKPTSYGIDFATTLVKDLAAYFPQLLVVSGLAFGIDAAAHRAALEAGVATIGVVAHGLNMIYPAAHRELAREIIRKGGALLSEYPFGESPYRQRFLERNRIVAALSDVTVVVESDIKGGAMSTANTAFSYSRDVMALPGRITDKLSSGCNHLIRKEKAHIITSAADLIELAGWKPLNLNIDTSQRNLFPELEGDQHLIYESLRYESEPMQVDRLHQLTLIPVARLMSLLGEMEFDGIITRHPGARFSVS